MLWIRVDSLTNETVAAEAHENPVYVCWQEKNSIMLRCSQAKAQGILSLDGSQVYHLYGRPDFGNGGEYMTAVEISEADYANLTQELGGETEPPEQPDPEQPEEEPPMTIPQMREKITALEQESASLQQQIDMLLSGVTSDE